jgi:pimeloyl-ACP methyl ester carboxylesterase
VAASAPLGRLVEVEGGAHMLPMTHPERIAELLRSVLA